MPTRNVSLSAGLDPLVERKIKSGSFVIFYRKLRAGVVVVRILHEQMQPERHPGR